MTPGLDPFSALRQPLLDTVRATIDGLHFSQIELLHKQIGRIETQDDGSSRWLAALVCFATADALGVQQRQALAGACAIALLEATASLINELAASEQDPEPDTNSLIAVWGKPRTLNAADGFFALAHAALLDLRAEGLGTEETLTATTLIDRHCAAWCEEVMQGLISGDGTHRATTELIKLGVELGTGLAGLSTADRGAIADFVLAPNSTPLSLAAISPEAKESIKALASVVGDAAKE